MALAGALYFLIKCILRRRGSQPAANATTNSARSSVVTLQDYIPPHLTRSEAPPDAKAIPMGNRVGNLEEYYAPAAHPPELPTKSPVLQEYYAPPAPLVEVPGAKELRYS